MLILLLMLLLPFPSPLPRPPPPPPKPRQREHLPHQPRLEPARRSARAEARVPRHRKGHTQSRAPRLDERAQRGCVAVPSSEVQTAKQRGAAACGNTRFPRGRLCRHRAARLINRRRHSTCRNPKRLVLGKEAVQYHLAIPCKAVQDDRQTLAQCHSCLRLCLFQSPHELLPTEKIDTRRCLACTVWPRHKDHRCCHFSFV